MTKLAEDLEDPDANINYWTKANRKTVSGMEDTGGGEGERMLEDDDESVITRAGWQTLFVFMTKRHKVTLLWAIILSIVSGFGPPVIAILLGKIFNDFTAYGAKELNGEELVRKVSIGCLGLVGVGSTGWLLNGSFYLSWILFGELQAKSVRDSLFEGLLKKDMEWYDKRKDGIGALITRCQTQIRELQSSTSQPLGFVIQSATATLVSIGVALYYSWRLTLVILAAVPMTAILLSFISTKMQPSIDLQKDNLAEAAKTVNGAVSSIDTVKAYNGHTYEIWLFSSAIRKAAKCYLAQARSNALQIGLVTLVTLSMFVQGFWYGSALLVPGGVTSGQIMTTFWACLGATQSFEQILPHMIVIEKGKAAGAALKAIMFKVQRGRIVTDMRGGLAPNLCSGDIDVKNVSFAYPTRPDRWSLNRANFFFPAGETTFVIGKSGSGKSTLGNILLRYYEANQGTIMIDGNPIQTLDVNWIRSNITLVQQQSNLFGETIFRNIALGRRDHQDIAMWEVKKAAEIALLQETLNTMPNGLSTFVGIGGNPLSGGQTQRIAIARARLRDTPILILDECTSALDQSSRSLVMDAIREWRRGKTTIIITHDVSQIQGEDYLYILDAGEVVQEGYRKALENDVGGPFFSFLEVGSSVKKPRPETDLKDSTNFSASGLRFADSIDSPRRISHISKDSFDIQLLKTAQYVPSLYRGPAHDTRVAVSLPPLSPLIDSPPTPTWPKSLDFGHSEGLELVEQSGLVTIASRNHIPIMLGGRASLNLYPKSLIRTSGNVVAPILNPPRRSHSVQNRELPLTPQRKRVTFLKIFSTVWPTLTWKMRIVLASGFLAALAQACSTPVFAFLFAKLLSTFYMDKGRSEEAKKWSLAVLAVAGGSAIASYLMHYLLEICGQAWVDSLRIEALKRILDQPRSWFSKDKNSLSKLGENLDRNAEDMRNLIGRFAAYVFVAAVMLVLGITWSLAISPELTLIGLSAAPFIYGITRGFEYFSGKWEEKSNDASEASGTVFTETFLNIRTVRALTLEDYFRKKYEKSTRNALRVGLRRAFYSGFFFGLTDSGIQFTTALLFYNGARLAGKGKFGVHDILTAFSLLIFSIAGVNQILGFMPQISSSKDTAKRVLRLANLRLGSHERYGQKKIPITGAVTFNNVSFSYPRSYSQVLTNFNLTIRPGTWTAVVGASGSGKSTLTALLLRLYAPRSGFILIDGIPINEYHTPTLRSQIAIVSQTPNLFNASVYANIAYGLPEGSYTTSDITTAAKQAGIHEFITTLPDTYNHLVGDRGAALSGGQAQRIAVARALARKPKILILDEATSSLDSQSAEVIRDAVRRVVREGMTVITVTHEKAMMKVVERICVLKGGQMAEEGTWDELMWRHGEFHRLVGGA